MRIGLKETCFPGVQRNEIDKNFVVNIVILGEPKAGRVGYGKIWYTILNGVSNKRRYKIQMSELSQDGYENESIKDPHST